MRGGENGRSNAPGTTRTPTPIFFRLNKDASPLVTLSYPYPAADVAGYRRIQNFRLWRGGRWVYMCDGAFSTDLRDKLENNVTAI